jgi:hypothetical protein
MFKQRNIYPKALIMQICAYNSFFDHDATVFNSFRKSLKTREAGFYPQILRPEKTQQKRESGEEGYTKERRPSLLQQEPKVFFPRGRMIALKERLFKNVFRSK